MTSFESVYTVFLNQITDDMYMEITEEETKAMLQDLLTIAIPLFEFPRQNLMDYDIYSQTFSADLTTEEINILAAYMIIPWIDQQLATVELSRMKYSGPDFHFTSQANHMTRLQSLKEDYTKKAFHLQRLYKRRKADDNGVMKSTMGEFMEDKPYYKTHRIGGWYK